MDNDLYLKLNNVDWDRLRETLGVLNDMQRDKSLPQEQTVALDDTICLLGRLQAEAARQLGADAIFGPDEEEN